MPGFKDTGLNVNTNHKIISISSHKEQNAIMQTVKKELIILLNYFCDTEHVRNSKTTKENKQLKKSIAYERG